MITAGLFSDLRECTMSQMKQSEIRNLKHQLSQMSGVSIYGHASAQQWTRAYQLSYDMMEAPDKPWPALKTLRTSVRKRLTRELPLITEREEALLKRIILFGGTTPLFSDDELGAAESLIRRLWCSCVLRDDGKMYLHIADTLMNPLFKCMSDEKYPETRIRIYTLSATLHSMLYLHGMMYADPAVQHLKGQLLLEDDAVSLRMLYRFLRAEFDYCLDGQGNLVLIHPGVMQPKKMLAAISNAQYQAQDYAREMIIGGMGEELHEEMAATDILRSELSQALQPGYNPMSMVDDLKILVKQGATHEQLTELVRDKLATQMNDRLENALRKVEMDTVRWQTAVPRRMN